MAIVAVEAFLAGRRVLYGVPTSDQIQRFWTEVTLALAEPIEAGVFVKNETMHAITLPKTEQRIRAKTCFNADTLRGDYADLLILDEYQLMDEDAWEVVGVPMLLDNNGDAIFIYTPPSLTSRSMTKARDPKHASKMYQRAMQEMQIAKDEGREPRWEAFHFTSHDNPHISKDALLEITKDMTSLAYRQEIEAEDTDEVPGSLWKRKMIDDQRIVKVEVELNRVAVGVDPPGGMTEAGIVAAGVGLCRCKGYAEKHAFVLEDASRKAPPNEWAATVITVYAGRKADRVVAEKNFGGDMVEQTIRTADKNVSFRAVNASRGKAVRAEPIVALYEQRKVHHVGTFDLLESEMCSWVPGQSATSPNRMDALVWVLTDLMLQDSVWRLY